MRYNDVLSFKVEFESKAPVPATFNLAISSALRGQYMSAKSYSNKALSDLAEVRGLDAATNFAIMFNTLAFIKMNENDYDLSITWLILAVNILQKELKENNLFVADLLNNLAIVYHKNEEHKEAEYYCSGATKIFERILSRNHPDVQKQLKRLSRFTEFKKLSFFPKKKEYEEGYYQYAVNLWKKIEYVSQSTATKLKKD